MTAWRHRAIGGELDALAGGDSSDPAATHGPADRTAVLALARFFSGCLGDGLPRAGLPGTGGPGAGDPTEVTLQWPGRDRHPVATAPGTPADEPSLHSDLGGALRQALHRFVQDDVLALDSLARQPADTVVAAVDLARTVQGLGERLIALRAGEEDCRLALAWATRWVRSTSWVATLDRVPPALYTEIAANRAQVDEWRSLNALGPDPDGAGIPPGERLVDRAFLEAHPSLAVDTRHFSRAFTETLLAAIGDLDAATTGVLVHGDNRDGMRFLAPRFGGSIDCVYTDPPYNTGIACWPAHQGQRSGLCSICGNPDPAFTRTASDRPRRTRERTWLSPSSAYRPHRNP